MNFDRESIYFDDVGISSYFKVFYTNASVHKGEGQGVKQ